MALRLSVREYTKAESDGDDDDPQNRRYRRDGNEQQHDSDEEHYRRESNHTNRNDRPSVSGFGGFLRTRTGQLPRTGFSGTVDGTENRCDRPNGPNERAGTKQTDPP